MKFNNLKIIKKPIETDISKTFLDIFIEKYRIHKPEKVKWYYNQYKYLIEIYNCLKDYGLHNEIYNRDKNTSTRYNIIIEHRNNRKTLSAEFLKLISFEKLEKEYLNVYKKEKTILINGTKIPYDSIERITITSTLLQDDEIINFNERFGIKKDLDFIKKCYDVTNNLLENSALTGTVELNSEIWSFIHPKIQDIVKPLFFNSLFSEAVLKAFIELNDIIKQDYKLISNTELDGDKLMRTVFTINNPIFHLTDLSTQNGRDIQQGYMDLFAGSIKGIRNPKAHKNIKIESIEALEKIILASHLLKVYDNRIK